MNIQCKKCHKTDIVREIGCRVRAVNQFCAVQEAECAVENDNVRLILRKVLEFVAPRCQILRLKFTKFDFS